MNADSNLQEYLAEIREHVCSRCIEQASRRPTLRTAGKNCGIELNLERLVDRVHASAQQIHGSIHRDIARRSLPYCTNEPTNQCPCPLKYLLLLAVEAIENVDQRRSNAKLESVAAAVGS